MIGSRRNSYDSLAWQTPALGFTAQAFLLTIALSADASSVARILAALLALIVALLAIQLLMKHEHMELIDSGLLEKLEKQLGIADALGVTPHTPAANRRKGLKLNSGKKIASNFVVNTHSPRLWTWGLALFGATSLAIIVATLIDETIFT
ncbi:MAG: hypothetical protein ACR2GT_12435 [Gaiellaceae bacterium]